MNVNRLVADFWDIESKNEEVSGGQQMGLNLRIFKLRNCFDMEKLRSSRTLGVCSFKLAGRETGCLSK